MKTSLYPTRSATTGASASTMARAGPDGLRKAPPRPARTRSWKHCLATARSRAEAPWGQGLVDETGRGPAAA
eukprot:911229-Pyramimonas_sp.AAC.1